MTSLQGERSCSIALWRGLLGVNAKKSHVLGLDETKVGVDVNGRSPFGPRAEQRREAADGLKEKAARAPARSRGALQRIRPPLIRTKGKFKTRGMGPQ